MNKKEKYKMKIQILKEFVETNGNTELLNKRQEQAKINEPEILLSQNINKEKKQRN